MSKTNKLSAKKFSKYPVLIPLTDNYQILLSSDQDVKVGKTVNESNEKCKIPIQLRVDTAHICKNLKARLEKILRDQKYMGDSIGKIGNQNFNRLVVAVKSTVKELCKRRKLHHIQKPEILEGLKLLKMHCAGIHVKCKNKSKCGREPILKRYEGKFDRKQMQNLLTAVFDNFLMADDMVQAIFDAGCSSQNEYHHSLLVNRRLVVKGESIHVSTYNFDASYAMSVLFYNLGEVGVFEELFGHFGLFFGDICREKFEKNEKLALIRKEHNLREKPAVLAQRVKNQKQNKDTAKSRIEYRLENEYLSVKERLELEKVTKNVTVRKKRKN